MVLVCHTVTPRSLVLLMLACSFYIDDIKCSHCIESIIVHVNVKTQEQPHYNKLGMAWEQSHRLLLANTINYLFFAELLPLVQSERQEGWWIILFAIQSGQSKGKTGTRTGQGDSRNRNWTWKSD